MYIPANKIFREEVYQHKERLPAVKGGCLMNNDNYSSSVQRTYTVEQIAKILGVSVRKAYMICENTNDFIVKRLGPRCLRINKESFDNWFNQLDQPP